jgi:hypothetical protein
MNLFHNSFLWQVKEDNLVNLNFIDLEICCKEIVKNFNSKDKEWKLIFLNVSKISLESFTKQFIKSISKLDQNISQFQIIFSNLIKESFHWRNLFSNKFLIITTTFEMKELIFILKTLQFYIVNDSTSKFEILLKISQLWKDNLFIKNSSQKHHECEYFFIEIRCHQCVCVSPLFH